MNRTPTKDKADSTAKVLGQHIASLRKASSLTQSQLAAVLGVEIETVSRYERGHLNVSLEQVDKLAEFFNVAAWTMFVPNSDQQSLSRLVSKEHLAALAPADMDTLMTLVSVYVNAHARPSE